MKVEQSERGPVQGKVGDPEVKGAPNPSTKAWALSLEVYLFYDSQMERLWGG